MKIFFRYLFVRLLIPFTAIFTGCAVIWIMVDLYGNIDDFLGHKVKVHTILYFYALRIPSMLIPVLPAALLFSVLWTLLSLNRRSELVAFQSGGMSPMRLFAPFFLFALIWVAVMSYDLYGPAATSIVTRDRVLQQVKGMDAERNVFKSLPFVDTINRRVWFFQRLDINQGKAQGVEILQRDAQGNDVVKYFAKEAKWIDGIWRLSGVLEVMFSPDGSVQDQKTFPEKDLDITTPPSQLSLIISQPEQLTLPELSRYIKTSTSTPEHLAGYRTEWWYRVLQPLSLIVLLLFALYQGMRTSDRRSAMVGVVSAVGVLLLFFTVQSMFMAAGRFNRLPPFVAVIATEVIFGVIGLHLLSLSNGWYWQVREFLRCRRSGRS